MLDTEKIIWDDNDFNQLGFHDNRLYSITFGHKEFNLTLDLDYIIKWSAELDMFWVVPAYLSFENVFNTKIELSFDNTSDIIIDSIKRGKESLTPNKKLTQREYVIETNVGKIVFIATGFKLLFRGEIVKTAQQDLDRSLNITD